MSPMRLVYAAAFGVGLLFGTCGKQGALSLLLRGVEVIGEAIVEIGDDGDDFVLISCNGRDPQGWGG